MHSLETYQLAVIALGAIAFGILLLVKGGDWTVDNAVVVVESIYQERERMPEKPRLASLVGTRNVAIALSAGTAYVSTARRPSWSDINSPPRC
jgi:multidrug efflux pump subunit AcrB